MGKQFAVFMNSTPKALDKENVPPPNSPIAFKPLSFKKRAPLTEITSRVDLASSKDSKFVYLDTQLVKERRDSKLPNTLSGRKANANMKSTRMVLMR